MVELILKDVEDEYAAENFFRLKQFIDSQILFDGDFKFFDVSIPRRDTRFKLRHGLSFTPQDIVPLSAYGDLNFHFRFQEFTKDYLVIFANGPVRIRFLAGKFKDKAKNGVSEEPFEFVAPGDVLGAAGPSFVFGAVGDKTSGFWLTSEGIPSNVVGTPVLFSDGRVVLGSVGTEVEANYTIGVYEHQGQGVGLNQIGSFSVISGGPKRFEFEFPVSDHPNIQLACRLESGSTRNLKVTLVVKGSSI